MMLEPGSQRAAIALLVLAVAGWYVAAKALDEAIQGRRHTPGRRALAWWVPTALVVIISLLANHPEIAIGVIFASSVACLTLVLGIVTIAAQPHAEHPVSAAQRRTWAFVLPAALVSLLAGFSGELRWTHAGILAIQGLAILSLWIDPTRNPAAAPSGGTFAGTTPDRAGSLAQRMSQLALAVVLAVVAGWGGVIAARDLSAQLGLSSAALPAALMLAPALVLPMIGTGSILAHEGRYEQVVTSQVGFVLLNLCGLLPLATTLWQTRAYWQRPVQTVMSRVDAKLAAAAVEPGAGAAAARAASGSSDPSGATTWPATAPTTWAGSTTQPDEGERSGLPYPIGVWRVDTVLLIAAGLLLLPVALGRWSLGQLEGFGLLAAYITYMILTTWMTRRYG
ncbi:hypothetical protein [Fontivita pretiosa]|jgi:hypothetical protein|uniref:hypothetical protein n=1 Tax=Fontivita pretiosa TaxID=2989684 RepID=UPI003D17D7A7